MGRRKNLRSVDIYSFCAIRLGMESEAYPPRSRAIDSWSRRLRLGLENWAVCAMVWKVAPICLGLGRLHTLIAKLAPQPPRWRRISSWLRRLRFDMENRTVSALVWKVMPSPLWSGKSHRIHLSREDCNLGRAVSASVWKLRRLLLGLKSHPSLLWSGKSGRLRLGLEIRTVSTSVARNIILVAPSLHRSEKLRRLCLGLKSRAVSALVWKVRSSPPWFLVAPSPPRPREPWKLFLKVAPSLHVGLESLSRCFGRATSASVAKVATDHHDRQSLDMPKFCCKVWTSVWDLDPGSFVYLLSVKRLLQHK